MQDISKVDKNFVVETDLKETDIVFYDVKQNDFCLFGIYYDGDCYRRMPRSVAEQISEGTVTLHVHTAGGRLRFRTDSPYVAISVNMPQCLTSPHMPPTGKWGFDLYANQRYVQTFTPPIPFARDGYDSLRKIPGEGVKDITINFPPYHVVNEIRIGLKEGASFLPPSPFKHNKKAVFYGSSITQGGCVSRPGMAYPNILANKLDFDIVNLGFSGNAKGETVMCDYIATLNPDIFVMDYDHNAPNRAELLATHEPFFLRFREKHPDVPVIFMSAPNVRIDTGMDSRREVVRATYENAVARGDKNVYYIDGYDLFGEEDWDICTVDGCHPNDLGHYRMAMSLEPIFKKLL